MEPQNLEQKAATSTATTVEEAEPLSQTESLVGSETPTTEEPVRLTTNTQDFLRELAGQLGEAPEQLAVRRDFSALLERMRDGVIVTLSLSRPRFFKKLEFEDLGLQIKEDLATSEEALKVINNYFHLGRRSLLPPKWREDLTNVENAARYSLKRRSLKTHWGPFIPVREYADWKKENAEHEAKFWQLRDELLANYDEIRAEVLKEFRKLAEDSWRRVTLGSSIKGTATVEKAVIEQLVERLHAGEGKNAFLDAYLTATEKAIPTRTEIEEAFTYRVEINVIPLPSLLAQDIQQADYLYQERILRDARIRAELERMELERQSTMRQLSAQEQEERQLRYLRLQAEQETLQLRQAMERDTLASARADKERLLGEFYSGVVKQINELIKEVTGNVLDSLSEHNGIIRGPVSKQLRNLVNQLKHLNFMSDEQLMQQIARIKSIIPSDAESIQARRGLARIDTSQMERVVREVHNTANEVLINLETMAGGPRRVRPDAPLDSSHLADLSGRKPRTNATGFETPKAKGTPRRVRSAEE